MDEIAICPVTNEPHDYCYECCCHGVCRDCNEIDPKFEAEC